MRGSPLPVDERLDDGSYLSHLHQVVNYHRRPTDVAVRVVEYRLDDPGRPDRTAVPVADHDPRPPPCSGR